MVFDVIFLRRGGRRRLRAEVVAELPLRGEITITGGGMHGRTAELVRLDAPGQACRRLANCNLTKLVGEHMIIAGVETVRDESGYELRERQTWWCRLPSGERPAPFDANPPSAVRRDSSYA